MNGNKLAFKMGYALAQKRFETAAFMFKEGITPEIKLHCEAKIQAIDEIQRDLIEIMTEEDQ